MLSHVCGDDGFSVRYTVNLLHDIRTGQIFVIVFQGIFFLQFHYMRHPLRMFLFRQAGIQFGQSLLQISYQRCIHTDILVDLRSIHIQLDDSCVLCELLRVTRHTV